MAYNHSGRTIKERRNPNISLTVFTSDKKKKKLAEREQHRASASRRRERPFLFLCVAGLVGIAALGVVYLDRWTALSAAAVILCAGALLSLAVYHFAVGFDDALDGIMGRTNEVLILDRKGNTYYFYTTLYEPYLEGELVLVAIEIPSDGILSTEKPAPHLVRYTCRYRKRVVRSGEPYKGMLAMVEDLGAGTETLRAGEITLGAYFVPDRIMLDRCLEEAAS